MMMWSMLAKRGFDRVERLTATQETAQRMAEAYNRLGWYTVVRAA